MAKTKKAENAQIKVTLVRSTIGCTEPQKAVVAALGLKKIRSFKIHNENPCILGMVKKVNHLVKVEKVEA
ncbi:MAG: 50S ribosomal protein L30 [Firmicutes bacterium]|jgi:ribosomal protein L30|nr:50S ribosomal protein L30 [Bacillota bacterium]